MLEIKLIDGSVINIEKQYIWIDEIFKDMSNTLDYIKIENYIFDKDSIISIKKVEVKENE